MKNVIIIGSSGFLGSALTGELLANGYHVFATQNKRPLPHAPGLTIIEGGITRLTTPTLNAIRPEAVFHCARPVLPQFRRWGRVIAALQANRLNRFLISQVAACQDKPTLVFASGSLVYGNSPAPHSEDTPLKPISYARQYHRGERPVLQAIRDKEPHVLMLRFPWMIGAGSWFDWFYLAPLKEKKLVPLFGNGSNLMSLISVTDAARMMVRAYSNGMQSGIYNVFSPFTLSQRAFAERIAGHYHGRVTDHMVLFPGGVEKAVYEAFTSNILLKTNHPELLENYSFQHPEQVLEEMTRQDSEYQPGQ